MSYTGSRALVADCSACSGLCCVGPAFDRSQGFGYDKRAYVPCDHLRRDATCDIHAARAARGFTACATFDCHGAGQWVTQRLFSGRSWREAPDLAPAMFEAYRRFRLIHELLAAAIRFAPDAVRLVEDAARREEAHPGSVDLGRLRRSVASRAAF